MSSGEVGRFKQREIVRQSDGGIGLDHVRSRMIEGVLRWVIMREIMQTQDMLQNKRYEHKTNTAAHMISLSSHAMYKFHGAMYI